MSVPGVWGNSALRSFWASATSDALGDALYWVFLAWVAGRYHASWLLALATIPTLLALPFGGVWADRRRLVAAARLTLAARAALAAGLAVLLASHVAVVWLVLPVTLISFVDGVHQPAMNSIAAVVGSSDATTQTQIQAYLRVGSESAEIVAGPLAGILIGWFLPSTGWLFAGLSLLGWALMRRTSSIAPTPPAPASVQGSLLRQFFAGIRALSALPRLRFCLLVFCVSNFVLTPLTILAPALLAHDRGWSGWQYGCVPAGFAVGALASALLVDHFAPTLKRPLVTGISCLAGQSAAFVCLAFVNSWWLAAVVVMVGAFVGMPGADIYGGQVQAASPDDRRGQVQAIKALAINVLSPAGYLVLGVLGAWSISAAIAILAATLLIFAVFAVFAAGVIEKTHPQDLQALV
ncbi:MFS transporter [Rudaeicoccus suwonensis]|uniref:MFS transporter n=1 Tax=Rudaeicoccus suwonensis TaxID=657409 RepID=A0A561DVG5_9MICO|nr:MFS transporter [Rudaeicoccus suwonensis]TWE07361.1 MFS transporter [Rudaeicoccus suwonensis]